MSQPSVEVELLMCVFAVAKISWLVLLLPQILLFVLSIPHLRSISKVLLNRETEVPNAKVGKELEAEVVCSASYPLSCGHSHTVGLILKPRVVSPRCLAGRRRIGTTI